MQDIESSAGKGSCGCGDGAGTLDKGIGKLPRSRVKEGSQEGPRKEAGRRTTLREKIKKSGRGGISKLRSETRVVEQKASEGCALPYERKRPSGRIKHHKSLTVIRKEIGRVVRAKGKGPRTGLDVNRRVKTFRVKKQVRERHTKGGRGQKFAKKKTSSDNRGSRGKTPQAGPGRKEEKKRGIKIQKKSAGERGAGVGTKRSVKRQRASRKTERKGRQGKMKKWKRYAICGKRGTKGSEVIQS